MTPSNQRNKSASVKSSGSRRGNAGRGPSELGKPPSGRQVSVVIPRRPNALSRPARPTSLVDSRGASTTTLNDSSAESHQSAETGATLTNDDIQHIDVEGDDDDEVEIVSSKLVREPSPRPRLDKDDSVEEEVVEELISPEVLLRRTQSSSPDPLTYSTEAPADSGRILLDFVDVDEDVIMGGVSAHHMPDYYGNLEDVLNSASDANTLGWPDDPPPPPTPQAPDRLFLRAPSSSPSKSASPTPEASSRSPPPPSHSPQPSSSHSVTPPPKPLQSLPSSPSKPRVHAPRHSRSDPTEVLLDQYLEADYAGLWWTDETDEFEPTVPIPSLPLAKTPTLTRHDGRSLTEQFVEIVNDWFGEEGMTELDPKVILARPRERGTPSASSETLGKRKRSDSPARTESVASSVKRDDTRSVSSGDLDLVRVFAEGVRPATDQDVNRVISLVARLKSLEGRVHKRFKGKTTNGAYYQVTIPKKLVRLALQHS